MYEYRTGDLVKLVGEHRLYIITRVKIVGKLYEVKYIHGDPKTEVGKIIDICDILCAVDHFNIK